jgi:hypothetical protein
MLKRLFLIPLLLLPAVFIALWACDPETQPKPSATTNGATFVERETDDTTIIQNLKTKGCPPIEQALQAEAFIEAKWAGKNLFAYMSSYKYFSECISNCTFNMKRVLVRVDPDGDQTRLFSRPWEQDTFVDISDNGAVIAFSDNDTIYVTNSSGDTIQEYSKAIYNDIVLSPDGNRVLLADRENQNWYLAPLPGDTVQKMKVLSSDRASHLSWSPDGSKLAYFNTASGNDTLTVITLDETLRIEPATIRPSGDKPLAWTTGSDAVFYYEIQDQEETKRRSTDPEYLHRIKLTPAALPEPVSHLSGVISPDGNRIAVVPRTLGFLEILDTGNNHLVFGDGGRPCG